MSEASVPLGARVKFLLIGALAGAALVFGLRPVAAGRGDMPSTPTAPTVAGQQSGGSGPEAPVAQLSTPAATPTVDTDVASAPVVTVDGAPITLRAVENTLLRQEGVQQLMDMLEEQFKRTNWEAMQDRDILIQTNTWRVSRLGVAAQLLKQKASDAREDLIGIALVEHALKREQVVIDDALIANEVKRMEKRHYEGLEVRKQPYVDFRAFIEQTQKMPLEQCVRQEGFRMGAGIRVLVERRASTELTDEQLQVWFEKNLDRYRVQPAADLSVIYIPYNKIKGKQGDELVTQEEKDRLMGVMTQFHQAIMKRQVSFDQTFRTFGRVYEQHSTPEGRLGWVNRDGTRPIKGSRRVDPRAMEDAFAAQPPYPVLLSPVASDQGIELIQVHARRAGKDPVFADLRSQLVSDIVDAELPARTKRTLEDLRRAAVIDYRSLPPLIEQRLVAAGLSSGLPHEVPAAP